MYKYYVLGELLIPSEIIQVQVHDDHVFLLQIDKFLVFRISEKGSEVFINVVR